MNQISQNAVMVKPFIRVREYYREEPKLFGLLKYTHIHRIESAGTVLGITCQKTPEKVIINGVEYQSNLIKL